MSLFHYPLSDGILVWHLCQTIDSHFMFQYISVDDPLLINFFPQSHTFFPFLCVDPHSVLFSRLVICVVHFTQLLSSMIYFNLNAYAHLFDLLSDYYISIIWIYHHCVRFKIRLNFDVLLCLFLLIHNTNIFMSAYLMQIFGSYNCLIKEINSK